MVLFHRPSMATRGEAPEESKALAQLYLRLTVDPGRVQDTVEALRAVMAPARFHSECTGVRLAVDVENPTVLIYSEDWRGIEALRRVLQSSRFTRLMELVEHSVEPPTTEVRFISEIRGLESIDACDTRDEVYES